MLFAETGAKVVVNDLGGEMDGTGTPTVGPALQEASAEQFANPRRKAPRLDAAIPSQFRILWKASVKERISAAQKYPALEGALG